MPESQGQEAENPYHCMDVREDLVRFLDGELCFSCTRSIEAHLAGCDGCEIAYRALAESDAQLREAFRLAKAEERARLESRRRRLGALGLAALAVLVVLGDVVARRAAPGAKRGETNAVELEARTSCTRALVEPDREVRS